ncbi:MAG: hypothetical protein CSA32_00790 [Desulfobulbus propionicus]|nr:MAG: hypothetical protein CSA32_00790 [Desulfobulbus propionicus]
MNKYIFMAVLALILCAGMQTYAEEQDEVLQTIEEAVKQYKAGEYADAASNLDYASQLVRQQKSEKIKQLLPGPLPGWKAEQPVAQAFGSAVLGGGVTVSREYTRGNSSMSVEIVSDSPVLESVIIMLNTPMFAGAGGGKLERVKGQKSIIKYDSSQQDGDIYIVVDGRFLVTVKGHKVSREELISLAGSIHFTRLSEN